MILIDCTCVVCGKGFSRPKGYERKTCGDECKQELFRMNWKVRTDA